MAQPRAEGDAQKAGHASALTFGFPMIVRPYDTNCHGEPLDAVQTPNLAIWFLMEVTQDEKNQLLEKISINPKVMVGKPVIKGTRLTVEYILNLLAHGSASEEILKEYEGLTQEDIQACLLFATRSLQDTDFMPLSLE